jgi:hypothetical protein
VHAALPVQSAVQPPFGQWIVQVLFPPHETVEPVSIVTSHVLPPAHETLLSVPVEMVQSLFPSHVQVQPEEHEPSHLSFASQWYVTLAGGWPPSVAPGPKLHVPAELHEQLVPLHEQSPLHVRSEPALLLPQPPADTTPRMRSAPRVAYRDMLPAFAQCALSAR